MFVCIELGINRINIRKNESNVEVQIFLRVSQLIHKSRVIHVGRLIRVFIMGFMAPVTLPRPVNEVTAVFIMSYIQVARQYCEVPNGNVWDITLNVDPLLQIINYILKNPDNFELDSPTEDSANLKLRNYKSSLAFFGFVFFLNHKKKHLRHSSYVLFGLGYS